MRRRKIELTNTANAPEQPRNRHGFRGVPPVPTNFSLSALADDALLNEVETAAILRLSTNTLGGWRQRPDHPLRWLALPNGYIRYMVSAIRAYLAMGAPRKPRDRRSKAARRSTRPCADDQPEAAPVP